MADSTTAQIGSQVELYFWDTLVSSPPQYAELGKVRSINAYGVDLPEVDSTTLDSDEAEFIPGLPTGKELSIMLTLTAATLANMEAIHVTPVQNITLKLIFPAPTNETRYFDVTPRGFEVPTITPSGLIETSFTARRSGPASETDPHV